MPLANGWSHQAGERQSVHGSVAQIDGSCHTTLSADRPRTRNQNAVGHRHRAAGR